MLLAGNWRLKEKQIKKDNMEKKITIQDLKNSIRDVPDFPQKGILFKDITTALKKPEIFCFIVEELYRKYAGKGITKVVGVESRGFIIGSVLAYELGAGFVPVRKPGKLPAETYSKSYSLEYGEGSLEIHKDALEENDVVLLHDDLLATGGSANASIDLIRKFNVKSISVSFIIELLFLEGRKKIGPEYDVYTLLPV
jgi:adenine phosphoribosyltransferase